MLNKIIDMLNELGVELYRINENTTSSVELFFVKKNLDMRRIADKHQYSVTVFRDFVSDDKPMRGSSMALIDAVMSDDALKSAISDAYYAASFVKNPTFALPEPKKSDCILMESKMAHQPLADTARQMASAIFAADNRKDSFVNSAEVFAQRLDERIISSTGTDVAYTKYVVKGEYVVQCSKPQDVEQYKDFSYDELSTDALKRLVSDSLDAVEARAVAFERPDAGNYEVILTGSHLSEVLSYYLNRSCARYIYPKYSNFAVGQSVQGDGIKGEKLNLTLRAKSPFSTEGIAMLDRTLTKDGILECVHGGARFCSYLGVAPTGDYSSLILSNGQMPIDSMRSGKRLEVVTFSDFQMDGFSGHFSGEIRLAYLYDNGQRIPLTGGSINGNIFECQSDLAFSSERYTDSTYTGPLAMLVKNVSVAGK